MFYCDPCGNEKGYPQSISKSHGKCEICGNSTLCSDVHHSMLPKSGCVAPDLVISDYVVSNEINLPTEPLESEEHITMKDGDKIRVISEAKNDDLVVKGIYGENEEAGEDGFTKLGITEEFIKANVESGIFKNN